MDGVFFIAGVYGVGKSTLCEKLSKKLRIPFYSSGDLISKDNGELYGANKVVKDKNKNQNILADAVRQIFLAYPSILLAGHFCIFNKKNRSRYFTRRCLLAIEYSENNLVGSIRRSNHPPFIQER